MMDDLIAQDAAFEKADVFGDALSVADQGSNFLKQCAAKTSGDHGEEKRIAKLLG